MTAPPSNGWAHWGRLIVRPTRERLGLSRAQLARKSGVSAYRILRLERGKTRHPKLLTLRALCNALDLPLPGAEGIYLSLDGVPADQLRRLLAEALYEFARRRRDAARFAALIHLPSNASDRCIATAAVEAERDLAGDVLGLLCPERDLTALASPPEPPTRQRKTPVPPLPLHRRPRHPARPHG